jgi:hypothetical protein
LTQGRGRDPCGDTPSSTRTLAIHDCGPLGPGEVCARSNTWLPPAASVDLPSETNTRTSFRMQACFLNRTRLSSDPPGDGALPTGRNTSLRTRDFDLLNIKIVRRVDPSLPKSTFAPSSLLLSPHRGGSMKAHANAPPSHLEQQYPAKSGSRLVDPSLHDAACISPLGPLAHQVTQRPSHNLNSKAQMHNICCNREQTNTETDAICPPSIDKRHERRGSRGESQ